MEQGIFQNLLDTFVNYKGIGFVSLQYRNKQGELSKRLLNIGARIDNAKKKDLELINTNGVEYQASDKYRKADWDLALSEVKQSLINPNDVRSNGQKNAYIVLNEDNGSVRYNMNTQEIYLFGKSEKKEVLEEGTYPVVKSSAKTLAKKDIQKFLNSSKFRTLILKNVCGTVKVNKRIIIIDDVPRETEVIDIVLE